MKKVMTGQTEAQVCHRRDGDPCTFLLVVVKEEQSSSENPRANAYRQQTQAEAGYAVSQAAQQK